MDSKQPEQSPDTPEQARIRQAIMELDKLIADAIVRGDDWTVLFS